MDPIDNIVALYNSLLSNPNNSITEDFDELNEYSTKQESIKNNQTELITVPTILLDYIKTALGSHITIQEQKQTKITPKLAIFELAQEKEQKDKKIIKSKKAKKKVLPNVIRHSLLQLKRTRLNFNGLQTSNSEDTLLLTVPKNFITRIKEGLLQKYQEDYQEYLTLLSNINKVESVRLADSLLDAESNNRRKKAIDEMISSLKRDDLLKQEETNKSVGIRIAS